MLNYVWAGLILFAFLFAMKSDVDDLRHDAFGNGRPLAVTISGRGPTSGRDTPVDIAVTPDAYLEHFHVSEPATTMPATLTALEHGYRLKFADDAKLPPRMATMREIDPNDPKILQAQIDSLPAAPAVGEHIDAQLKFAPVRFVKLRAIINAALETAKSAVLTITFGLIGVLALWLGLMRIAESCGLIEAMVKLIQPLLRPLFPDVPTGHPAMGYIAVNLAGNILGLGNATTAMGLKAMEELQTLNPDKETASDSMVMLLALHTAAFQLVPPATLIAVMGSSAMEVFVPMLLVGLIATVIAAIAAKALGRLPMYRLREGPGTWDTGQAKT